MNHTLIKIVAGITYVAMVVVNYLANGLPINGRSTGEISDAYPNLFAPAGITFSIWGLIYLLLAGYVLYQFFPFGRHDHLKSDGLLRRINIFFIATSLANISWVFAWHYDLIGLSVGIMAVLLFLLIRIADTLREASLTSSEKIFVSLPFSVYFGWITIATIANVTVFLVSIGWNGLGVADFIWTSILVSAGALIGILRLRKDNSVSYGLVLIWGYLGILYKHLSSSGFDGKYPSIIVTVMTCVALLTFFVVRLAYKK